MTDADCLICRKHRSELPPPGGFLVDDELVAASHVFDILGTGRPTLLGHLIVEPKRHAKGLETLEDDEARAIGLLVSRLAKALVASEGAEHVYSVVMGHGSPHLHVHVLPRYPGTPREHWFLDVYEWEGARLGGPDEIAEVTARIRSALHW